jgi:sugar fermentation stimulation protein A
MTKGSRWKANGAGRTKDGKSVARRAQRSSLDDRGTYALVIYLPRPQTIRVGALGAFRFPRGYYIYIGSALKGLGARVARHCRKEKKCFWHIDYLLEHARVIDVWTHASAARLECQWARAALTLSNARVVAPRFGASDCHCAAHLVHLRKPNTEH